MIFIDYFKDFYKSYRNDIKNMYQIDEIELVNILLYINIRYNVSITTIASILGVSRQSVYNHLYKKTKDLPEIYKNKLAVLFGETSFERYLEIEFINSIKEVIIDHMTEDIEYDLNRENQHYKYFQSTSDGGFEIKSLYDTQKRWKKAKLIKIAQSIDQSKVILSSQFLAKHSYEYLEKLFNELNNYSRNDVRLLNKIKNRGGNR